MSIQSPRSSDQFAKARPNARNLVGTKTEFTCRIDALDRRHFSLPLHSQMATISLCGELAQELDFELLDSRGWRIRPHFELASTKSYHLHGLGDAFTLRVVNFGETSDWVRLVVRQN